MRVGCGTAVAEAEVEVSLIVKDDFAAVVVGKWLREFVDDVFAAPIDNVFVDGKPREARAAEALLDGVVHPDSAVGSVVGI